MSVQSVLLFGGAFNPPHIGHRCLFEAAFAAIKPDLAYVVPTRISPHKKKAAVSFYHRFRMSQVFKSAGKVKISGMENRGRKRRNYTIRTLEQLRDRYPEAVLYLLIGGDMLLSFDTWKEYRRVLQLAALIVGRRGDEDEAELDAKKEELEKQGGRIIWVSFEPLPVSSTEIRELVKNGRPYRSYVDEPVRAYIEQWNLYREKKTSHDR